MRIQVSTNKETVEKNILARDFWKEYGEKRGFLFLKSWRALKISKFSDLFSAYKKVYFYSLLSSDAENLQKNIADSLTATGIISVLVLSVTFTTLDDPTPLINPNNMFSDATDLFNAASQILGIISFITSAFGTFFVVMFYSFVVRIPKDSFPAYLQKISSIPFGLIWGFPSTAIMTYIISVVIRIILTKNQWIGIFTIITFGVVLIFTQLLLLICDAFHALAVSIESMCLKEKENSGERKSEEEEKILKAE